MIREGVYISLVLNEMLSLGNTRVITTLIRPVVGLVRSSLVAPDDVWDSLGESQRRQLLSVYIAKTCFRMEALVGCMMFLTHGRRLASNVRYVRTAASNKIPHILVLHRIVVCSFVHNWPPTRIF